METTNPSLFRHSSRNPKAVSSFAEWDAPSEDGATRDSQDTVMKRRISSLAFLCFIAGLASCSHSTGPNPSDAGPNGDATDDGAPVLTEIEPIPEYTSDVTPLYRFSSTKPGVILYRGACQGDLERAVAGEMGVHLGPLEEGAYQDCALAVRDQEGNQSEWLAIPPFVVDTTPPDPPDILSAFDRTKDANPQVSLGGEPDTDVLADGSEVGRMGSDGTTIVTIGPFTDGTHDMEFRLRDRSGNISDPTSLSFLRYSHLASCEDEGRHDTIREDWADLRTYFENLVSGSATRPYNLYNAQILSAPLLRYALERRDEALLSELAAVYAGAADTLTTTDQYVFYYFPTPSSPRDSVHTLDRPHPMWLDPNSGAESVLVTSQFLYAVSLLLRHAASLPQAQRSSQLTDLTTRLGGPLADHYARLVLGITVDGTLSSRGPFQVRGWGCRTNGDYVETGMSHRRMTELKLAGALGDASSPLYCNAVTDTDLWLFAGVANLLASHEADPTLMDLDSETDQALRDYLGLASSLLEDRTTFSQCRDDDDQTVECAGFDQGTWDDHSNFAYSGYQGADFPDQSDQAKATHVGWDISHARRFVEAFQTLHDLRSQLGYSFPSTRTMEGFARQVSHEVFLGDFALPLFSNFMDGTNGWYRVGYSGRDGFGYGPSDLSISMLTGGYALWIQYDLQLKSRYEALDAMLQSSDPTIQAHLDAHYEHCFYSNYERAVCFDWSDPTNTSTRLVRLQYYSSVCF